MVYLLTYTGLQLVLPGLKPGSAVHAAEHLTALWDYGFTV